MNRRLLPKRVLARVALGLLALAALLWGSVEAVLRSDWPLQWMRQRLVSHVEQGLGGDVSIDQLRKGQGRLSFELLGLSVEGEESGELLTVPRAEGRLAWRTLLGTRPVVDQLVVHRPVVALAGGGLAAQAVNSLAGLTSFSDLDVRRFELRDGRLEWNGRQYPLSARGRGLSVRSEFHPSPREHRIEASIAEIEFSAWERLALSGLSGSVSALVRGNVVEITSASLHGADFEAVIGGTLQGSQLEAVSSEYRLRMGARHLAAALGLEVQTLPGNVEISGGLDWDSGAGQPRYSGKLSAAGLRLPVLDAELEISGEYAGVGDSLEVADLRGRVLDGNLQGALSLTGLLSDWTMSMTGEASAISFSEVALGLGTSALPWDGLLGLRWVSSGSRRAGVRTEVAVEVLPVASPAKLPVTATARLAHSSGSGRTDIPEFWLNTPNLEASGKGHLAADGSGQVQLELALASTEAAERFLAVARTGLTLPPGTPGGSYAFSGALGWSGPTVAGARLDGTVRIEDISLGGQDWGSLELEAAFRPDRLLVRRGELADGDGRLSFSGIVPLLEDGATDLRVSAVALDVAKVARTAGLELPVSGILEMSGRLLGTRASPVASGAIALEHPECFGERFDRLEGRIEYAGGNLSVLDAELWRGRSTLRGNASFGAESGQVELDVASSQWPLEEFTWVRILSPETTGSAQFTLRGSGLASRSVPLGDLELAGAWAVTGLEAGGRNLGDWTGRLRSDRDDPELHLEWDAGIFGGKLRGAALIGEGGSGRYRGNVDYVDLSPLKAVPLPGLFGSGARASVTGSAGFSGVLGQAGSFELTGTAERVELGLATSGEAPFQIANVFPLRWGVRGGMVRLDSMSLSGPDTSFQIDGTIGLGETRALDIGILGELSLSVLRGALGQLRPSGPASVRVDAKGTLDQPALTGSVVVRGASLEYPNSPFRVRNLRGRIVLDGSEARIESLSGQSGGGEVHLGGVAQLGASGAQYRLHADVEGVRVDYPARTSSVIDARLTLAGAGLRSLLDGRVLVSRLSTAEGLSISEVIANIQQPTALLSAGPLLDGMQLNLQIGSVPQLPFETQLVRDVEASLEMSVVGSASAPALMGEVRILEGELRMLGTHYHINRGEVRFLGPAQAQPVLDFDLETRIRDVDLELVLSGPLSNLNLSYRSDPPLPFHDLVDLIAVGKDPTVDPSISSRRRLEQQSVVQTGADAILSQALSRPVSKRLQRFFGVSRLKVDPQIGGLESNPSARLSTEQQIADDITLIYSYDLSSAQQQAIRIEWNPDRKWSFIVTRDQNGMIGSDILFKLRRR